MIRRMCLIWVSLWIFAIFTVSRYNGAIFIHKKEDLIEKSEIEKLAEKEAPIIKILCSSKFWMLFVIASTHKS